MAGERTRVDGLSIVRFCKQFSGKFFFSVRVTKPQITPLIPRIALAFVFAAFDLNWVGVCPNEKGFIDMVFFTIDESQAKALDKFVLELRARKRALSKVF